MGDSVTVTWFSNGYQSHLLRGGLNLSCVILAGIAFRREMSNLPSLPIPLEELRFHHRFCRTRVPANASDDWNPIFDASDMCQRRLSRLFFLNSSLENVILLLVWKKFPKLADCRSYQTNGSSSTSEIYLTTTSVTILSIFHWCSVNYVVSLGYCIPKRT